MSSDCFALMHIVFESEARDRYGSCKTYVVCMFTTKQCLKANILCK